MKMENQARPRNHLGVIALLAGDSADETLAGEGTVAHDDEAGVGDLAEAFAFESEGLADQFEGLPPLREIRGTIVTIGAVGGFGACAVVVVGVDAIQVFFLGEGAGERKRRGSSELSDVWWQSGG